MAVNSPQYLVSHQTSVSPGTTAVTSLFSTNTPASSAIILPLSGNSGDVLVGVSPTPLAPGGLTLPAMNNGRFYNLKDFVFSLTNSADGVLIIWFTPA